MKEQGKATDAIRKYRIKPILTEEEEFIYIESLEYMIKETKDTDYMIELGGNYYEKKIFDKALKYYEMADAYEADAWFTNPDDDPESYDLGFLVTESAV